MAVGKGSMERAAKAATEKNGTDARKTKSSVKSAEVIAAPKEEVFDKVVYQSSAGMLDRDAEPNERFSVGDPMPVYYF